MTIRIESKDHKQIVWLTGTEFTGHVIGETVGFHMRGAAGLQSVCVDSPGPVLVTVGVDRVC